MQTNHKHRSSLAAVQTALTTVHMDHTALFKHGSNTSAQLQPTLIHCFQLKTKMSVILLKT